MQGQQRDDLNNAYINRSRRRMVDPRAAIKAEVEEKEQMNAAMVAGQPVPRFPEPVVEPQAADFMQYFSQGDKHVREVKQLQSRVLE